jgi:hypothetical protein
MTERDPKPAATGYAEVWRQHRKYLVRFWQSVGATAVGLCTLDLLHLPTRIVIVAFLLPSFFYQAKWRALRCPRCGNRFYTNGRGAVWSAAACRHCGLRLEAPYDPDRPPLGEGDLSQEEAGKSATSLEIEETQARVMTEPSVPRSIAESTAAQRDTRGSAALPAGNAKAAR